MFTPYTIIHYSCACARREVSISPHRVYIYKSSICTYNIQLYIQNSLYPLFPYLYTIHMHHLWNTVTMVRVCIDQKKGGGEI